VGSGWWRGRLGALTNAALLAAPGPPRSDPHLQEGEMRERRGQRRRVGGKREAAGMPGRRAGGDRATGGGGGVNWG
jgi:hypothetical protein